MLKQTFVVGFKDGGILYLKCSYEKLLHKKFKEQIAWIDILHIVSK